MIQNEPLLQHYLTEKNISEVSNSHYSLVDIIVGRVTFVPPVSKT